MAQISVIIPTSAVIARRASLNAAIESLMAQDILPIVVANGARCDNEILAGLKADRRIRFIYREEGSAPKAVEAGRASVDTEFFGMLDDDDLYLRDAAAIRLCGFFRDPTIHVVVTAGFIRTPQADIPYGTYISDYSENPALALMGFNWLPSCAALYKTSSVGPEFFADAPRYMEWTYLALKLALSRNIRFLDEPTFVIDQTTPHSESKSADYIFEAPHVIEKMIALNPPKNITRKLKQKHAAALHDASARALSERKKSAAWKFHIASLRHFGGLRYVSYTRHLIT